MNPFPSKSTIRRYFSRFSVLTAASLVIAGLSNDARAVIVAGGITNTSEIGLQNYLNEHQKDAFPYWGNMVRVSDASGVYLGYNPATSHGWVLSANHVTHPTSITVDGTAYSVVGTQVFTVDGSDLCLYEIGGGPMPTLPVVQLASSPANAGEEVVMIGRGFSTTSTAPYTWGTPGTSDANGMHWGVNTVEYNVSGHLFTDFDTPGGGVSPFEAQAALGDSGGGMFIDNNGVWELYGIAHFTSEAGVANYGDMSGYSRVFPEVSQIQGFTGLLIPEPSCLSLLAISGVALLRRRRQDS